MRRCASIRCMRTTLDIEDDVLQAAKERARQEHSTAGKILSTLARKGLSVEFPSKNGNFRYRNGVPLLPRSGEIVTLEHIQELIDEEGI